MSPHLIRNIFDQYHQPENRLTHALIHVLAREPLLAREFVKFATNSTPPRGVSFSFACQSLPGNEPKDPDQEEDAERQGLPDAWIFDEDAGWTIICECKVTASLKTGQLRRHVATAQRRKFNQVHVLVVTADETKPSAVPRALGDVPVSWMNWPAIFEFFGKWSGSDVAAEFANYVRVLEGRLMAEDYDGPPLTKFTGIPFGLRHPYNEPEAKLVLRALMAALRTKLAASRTLPRIDAKVEQKPLTGAWDIVRFAFASGRSFNSHPHLSVGITRTSPWKGFGTASIQLVLPHKAEPGYWNRIRSITIERAAQVLGAVADAMRPLQHPVERGIWEPKLTLEICQRHFHARKDWTRDGVLDLDVATLIPKTRKSITGVKRVPAWLQAVHVILAATRRANFELALKAQFPLSDRSVCRSVGFIDKLDRSAAAFQPFLKLLRG